MPTDTTPSYQPSLSLSTRLMNNRNVMGLLFMFPAGVLLLVFLTYPLGLGIWLGLTIFAWDAVRRR